MEVMDAIRKRRSARRFRADTIPDNVLHEMLEAASLAPSPGNAQDSWFGVVDDPDLKTRLAEAAGEQMWIATAPVVIACCADIGSDLADCADDDSGLIVNRLRFGEDLIQYLNNYSDRKSVCMLFHNAAPLIPAEHMFLAAVSHGLSACFVGFLDTKRAGEILDLPENVACLFLLPVGYADEMPEEISRKSMNEIAFHNRWQ